MSDTIRITSHDGTTSATFIPAANLVCSLLEYRGESWFDPIREREAAELGKDYGLSLVHPWAGRLGRFGYSAAGREVALSEDDEQLPHDKHGLPIHGVWDRLLQWEVVAVDGHALVARLSWSDPDLLRVFPFPHVLTLTATIDTGRLHVETVLQPTGGVAVPVAFGFHAFLRIPGSARADWTMRLDATERLVLTDTLLPTGETVALPEREYAIGDIAVDEDVTGFGLPATLAFADGDATVSVDLEEGFALAHVFAPAGRELVSFEPMTSPSDALNSGRGLRVVEPGASFRASLSIRLP